MAQKWNQVFGRSHDRRGLVVDERYLKINHFTETDTKPRKGQVPVQEGARGVLFQAHFFRDSQATLSLPMRSRFRDINRHMTSNPFMSKYESWSKENLIARIVQLESRSKYALRMQSADPAKPFQFSAYPRRKIAIKFCYSGWEYNGLAFQVGHTPLPTVEEVLYAAFIKTRLIDPDAGLDGCSWEKCGRTDRGVSAAGQVISLWVRSALIDESAITDEPHENDGSDATPSDVLEEGGRLDMPTADEPLEISNPFNAAHVSANSLHRNARNGRTVELGYVSMLNRILPPSIRVLAWSPVSPEFSARFNCQHRHYKYFFSANGLDISRMQQAANRLIGEHDFRNMCKLDPTKQIKTFRRRILKAEINPVSSEHNDGIYVLDLLGTAFLYHQVRHIISILFLVGTGLEDPFIVSALLHTSNEDEFSQEQPALPVVDRKPEYEMADALPLMLWDCAYAESDVQWRADESSDNGTKNSELYHQLEAMHSRSLIRATLEAHFLSAASNYHPPLPKVFPLSMTGHSADNLRSMSEPQGSPILRVPLGGGTHRRTAKYIPLLARKRLESVEVVNERWLAGKGERREDRKRAAAIKGADVADDEDGDE